MNSNERRFKVLCNTRRAPIVTCSVTLLTFCGSSVQISYVSESGISTESYTRRKINEYEYCFCFIEAIKYLITSTVEVYQKSNWRLNVIESEKAEWRLEMENLMTLTTLVHCVMRRERRPGEETAGETRDPGWAIEYTTHDNKFV